MQRSNWSESAAAARLHFVSGKGGTGKTTVAAALALALAAGGKRVLLAEVEGRQGIAQLFQIPPLPYAETPVALLGDGAVLAQPIDVEAAFLEYLDVHYKVGFAAKGLRKIGAVEFATGIAPGLRDVILTGKLEELVARDGAGAYDAIVVDAPPTGRVGAFLDVAAALAGLAESGPLRAQTQGIAELLHSPRTQVHLVTLLEALPVQETIDGARELAGLGFHIGSVVVNQADPVLLPEPALATAAASPQDTARSIGDGLALAGLSLPDRDLEGLARQASDHAARALSQRRSEGDLAALDLPTLRLPTLRGGVDPESLHTLAGLLTDQGAR